MGAMQQIKRVLRRAGHFVPHFFVVLEAVFVLWKIQAIGQPGIAPSIANGIDAGVGAMDLVWMVGALIVTAAVLLGPAIVAFVLHEGHCTICLRYRRNPRYSPILMSVGRPWWTVRGPSTMGLLATLLLLIPGMWFNWVLVVHYVLMMGYWLGFIGYLRLGAGRTA